MPAVTPLHRVLALLGALAFLGLALHVVAEWPAVDGVEPWLRARLHRGPLERFFYWPMVAYGGALLVLLLRRPGQLRQAPTLWGSGLLALSYAVLHGARLHGLAAGPHSSPRAIYDALFLHASEFPNLLFHVFGVCAVVVHVGMGAHVSLRSFLGLPRPMAGLLATSLAVATLAALVQLLSHFVLGEMLLVP